MQISISHPEHNKKNIRSDIKDKSNVAQNRNKKKPKKEEEEEELVSLIDKE